MTKRGYERFVMRCGMCLLWAPDDDEDDVAKFLRLSIVGPAGHSPRGHFAKELNRLFTWLSPYQARELQYAAKAIGVTLDETLSYRQGQELMRYLNEQVASWDEDEVGL